MTGGQREILNVDIDVHVSVQIYFFCFFLMKDMMSTSSLKVKLLQIDVEIDDCCKKNLKGSIFMNLYSFNLYQNT